MNVTTVEGTVEKGQIRLPANVHLPDNAKVYTVIPDLVVTPTVHVSSPRFVRAGDAAAFEKQVIQETPDAGLRSHSL
jgi:hypothetical protein